MLGTTFYNESIKKVLVAFGTLFNNISLERVDASGNKEKIMVPFSYAPRSKVLQAIQGQGGVGEDSPEVGITMPRMAFEWSGLTYDTTRKLNTMQRTAAVKSGDSGSLNYRWQRVPYNMDITLSLYVDTTEDGLKIVEQILPFFTPEFNVTITDVITHDMPITLSGVTFDDTWSGDFSDFRVITWTLTFQAKTYLYGPEKTSKIIKETITQQYADILSQMDDVTSSTLNRAISRITNVPNPTTADADDSYTYTETRLDE